jgi:protocatechuate 3,4-dioxygenase beta subunit
MSCLRLLKPLCTWRYGVPDDGPVGVLLMKAGLPLRRPAHLQFLIRTAGFETLVTHLHDGSDPHLDEDPLFAVKPELICRFERIGENPVGCSISPSCWRGPEREQRRDT